MSVSHAPWMHAGRALRAQFFPTRAWTKQLKNAFVSSYQLLGDTKQHSHVASPLDSLRPQEPSEASIFEELSDEYAQSQTVPDVTVETPAEKLFSMVETGRYNDAAVLHREVIAMGTVIPHSEVYEKAAIHALQADVSSFATWLSLYPDVTHARQRSFSTICSLLFRADVPDIRLITQFGSICARKGYGASVAPRVVPYVVRFARPAVSMPFIRQFSEEVRQFHMENGVAPRETRKVLRWIYSRAIRTHAVVGRSQEAVWLVEDARNLFGIAPTPFTHQLLAAHLLRTNEKDLLEVVDRLRPEWHGSIPPQTAPTMQKIPPSIRKNLIQTMTRHGHGEHRRSILARSLRLLRRSIISYESPPIPMVIAFVLGYRALRQRRGIRLLQHRMCTHSFRTRYAWFTAQLVHYHEQRQWPSVLAVFADNFHLLGVPRARVEAIIHERMARDSRVLMTRLWGYIEDDPAPKLWPTAVQTALVWSALYELCGTAAARDALYYELVAQGHAYHAATPEPPSDEATYETFLSTAPTGPAPALAPTPTDVLDSAHFTPFMRANPERAIRDMAALGVRVNVHHLSVLARSLARSGDAARVSALLDRMEAEGEEDAEVRPNVVTYTGVLQGFVEAGSVDAARAVEARMLARGVDVENEKSEWVLRMLRRAEGTQKLKNQGVQNGLAWS